MDRDDSSLKRRPISASSVPSVEGVLQLRWPLGRHFGFSKTHVALSPDTRANKGHGIVHMLGLDAISCVGLLER